MILEKGTVLFHGTSVLDYEEAYEALNGPAWVSSSLSVAQHFAKRSKAGGEEGACRVVEFVLQEDVELPEIYGQREMQEFAEEHNLSLLGSEDIVDSVLAAGLPGWILPFNYPDGDDILLCDTSVLAFACTHFVG